MPHSVFLCHLCSTSMHSGEMCACLCVCVCVCVWAYEADSSCLHDSLRSESEWLDPEPADGKQCVWELSDYQSHQAVMRPWAQNEKHKHRQPVFYLPVATHKPKSGQIFLLLHFTNPLEWILSWAMCFTHPQPPALLAAALLQYPDERNPKGKNKPQPIITPASCSMEVIHSQPPVTFFKYLILLKLCSVFEVLCKT